MLISRIRKRIKRSSMTLRWLWAIAAAWTLIIAASITWNTSYLTKHIYSNLRSQALATYNADLTYRLWNASHGGVYVPATDTTPPNPFLSHIPERDITTPSGKQLTLVNPAYMTRQVHEMSRALFKGHITSLNPIRAENRADVWETAALKKFESGATEVSSLEVMGDGQQYFRFMRPLITEQACLKCHANQGYQLGDIRGGLSVSIPSGDQNTQLQEQKIAFSLGHGVLWLLGLFAIYASRRSHIKAEFTIKNKQRNLEDALKNTVTAIAKALEARDPYTSGHQSRVAKLAKAIATEMGLSKEQIEGVYLGANIHDIGKIQLPSETLSKPGKLSDIEFALVQDHAQVGYELLDSVHFPWPLADIAHQHHERMDGSGYPQGLTGEDICLEARIVAVADVVEAISSHRPYRPAQGIDVALDEIHLNRGKLYDAKVVDICIRLFKEKGFAL